MTISNYVTNITKELEQHLVSPGDIAKKVILQLYANNNIYYKTYFDKRGKRKKYIRSIMNEFIEDIKKETKNPDALILKLQLIIEVIGQDTTHRIIYNDTPNNDGFTFWNQHFLPIGEKTIKNTIINFINKITKRRVIC